MNIRAERKGAPKSISRLKLRLYVKVVSLNIAVDRKYIMSIAVLIT